MVTADPSAAWFFGVVVGPNFDELQAAYGQNADSKLVGPLIIDDGDIMIRAAIDSVASQAVRSFACSKIGVRRSPGCFFTTPSRRQQPAGLEWL
jgi:hypothetical protein